MTDHQRASGVDIGNLVIGLNSNVQLNELKHSTNQLAGLQEKISNQQSELVALQRSQVKLQHAQVELQKQMLLQQKIQSNLLIQSEIRANRQRELKSSIFSFNEEIQNTLLLSDRLERYTVFSIMAKELDECNIHPKEFEEIQDKEYVRTIIESIHNNIKLAFESLTDKDQEDLITLKTSISSQSESRSKSILLESDIKTAESLKNKIYIKLEKTKSVIAPIVWILSGLLLFVVFSAGIVLIYVGVIIWGIIILLERRRTKPIVLKQYEDSDDNINRLLNNKNNILKRMNDTDISINNFLDSHPTMRAYTEKMLESGQEAEEQTGFSVILTVIGAKKIRIIKEVRAITNLSLKEAKALVDTAPSAIKEGVSKDEAMAIKARIEKAGGHVELM